MICLTILLALLGWVNAAFDHNVKPSCPADQVECEFDWDINYLLTMTLFNWTTYMGEPINFKNDALCKRDIFACGSDPSLCTPVTKEELDKIAIADGIHTMTFAINNEFPGPSIIVYEHQKVKVRVKNSLLSQGITIHWHGMHQINTPWMDGVPMISQCPISPGQSFTYRFDAYPAGTHWYHSHVGTQRTEGLSGALIVLPREKKSSHVPPRNDFVLLVQDWMHTRPPVQLVKMQEWYMLRYAQSFDDGSCFVSTKGNDDTLVGTQAFESALINGKGQLTDDSKAKIENKFLPIETFHVTSGGYFRFRMINTGNIFPFRISIDNHDLEVVASDGHDVEPVRAQSVMIGQGERYDVLVHANAKPGSYWIRAQTLDVYEGNSSLKTVPFEVLAVLHYMEVTYDRPRSKIQNCRGSEVCRVINCPFTTDSLSVLEPKSVCVPVADLKATKESLKEIPVAIPSSSDDFQEVFLNFHFNSDDIRYERASVNGFQFRYPSSALQLYPNVANSVISCSKLKSGEPKLCTQIVKLKKDKVTQLTISNNDGLVRGMLHPVHLHGTSFHVLKMNFPMYDNVTGYASDYAKDLKFSDHFRDQNWQNPAWNGGKVPGINLKNPPLKDTVSIPRRGYAVIRFRATNPGYWIMHCHIENHQLIGMSVLIQVGEPNEMTPEPAGIPKCGNFDWDPNPDAVKENPHLVGVTAPTETDTSCQKESSGYVFVHQIWIILVGSLGIGLLCACFGLGIYIVLHKRKYGKYYYIPFPTENQNDANEKSKLIG